MCVYIYIYNQGAQNQMIWSKQIVFPINNCLLKEFEIRLSNGYGHLIIKFFFFLWNIFSKTMFEYKFICFSICQGHITTYPPVI